MARGLTPALAAQVADQLTAHDALGAHARDELGIHESVKARPIQAAIASAASFTVGAVLPLVIALVFPVGALMWAVSGSSLVFLALLGSLSARAGGARVLVAAARVTF